MTTFSQDGRCAMDEDKPPTSASMSSAFLSLCRPLSFIFLSVSVSLLSPSADYVLDNLADSLCSSIISFSFFCRRTQRPRHLYSPFPHSFAPLSCFLSSLSLLLSLSSAPSGALLSNWFSLWDSFSVFLFYFSRFCPLFFFPSSATSLRFQPS